MNRPVVWVCVPFIAGLALGSYEFEFLGAAAAIGGVCGVFAAIVAGYSDLLVRLACVLLFGSGGVLYWAARHADPPSDPLLYLAMANPDTKFELEGRVDRPDIFASTVDYGQFVLRVDAYRTAGAETWTGVDAGVQVRWTSPQYPVFSGDRVRIAGQLESALSVMNPEVSSYEDYLRWRGVHTAIRLRGNAGLQRIESDPAWSPSYWASRLRLAEAEGLMRVIPAESVPFVLTVWLGERRLMDNAAYWSYVQSGTAHILSVSGVHTVIVYLSIAYVMRLVFPDYRYRHLRRVLALAAVLVFVSMAGARVSSFRSAAMIGLFVLAQFHDRDPDAPTALGLAALLFALIDPDVIFDAGFILSFLSIASMLIYLKPIAEYLEWAPRGLRDGLSASISVQILSTPAAAAIFYTVPILGPLANLLVVPLLTLGLWLMLIASVLVFVYEPAAMIFGHALYPIVFLIERAAAIGASVHGAYIEVVRPSMWVLAACAFAAWALHRGFTSEKFSRRWFAAAAVSSVAAIGFWGVRPNVNEVVFLDVGQGDATVVRSKDGGVLVVDAGDRIASVDYGERSVAAYLRSQGISRIDALVTTHADKDHAGGIEYVLRHFRVDALYLTHTDSGDVIEDTIEGVAAERGVPLRRIASGEPLEVAGLGIEVLNPPAEWDALVPDNDRSIVLRVMIGGKRVLLTGDIEADAERRIAGLDCRADILKVPHHGSRTSSSGVFVDAVNPELVVVSTGRAGRKRILSQAVLESYAERGIEVLRTDFAGGVRVRFGDGLDVTTARGLRGYPHPGSGTLAGEK